MKKVLVVGEFFSSNLGDGVICELVSRIISKDHMVDFCDLSAKTSFSNECEGRFSKRKEYARRIKKSLRKKLGLIGVYKKNQRSELFAKEIDKKMQVFGPDYIVFAGGQIFSPSFVDCVYYAVKKAKKNNIKVIFNACGVGDLSNPMIAKKIKESIESDNVIYVSIRDGYKKMTHLIDGKEIHFTYDTAIQVSNYHRRSKEKEIIGIGIMLDYNHDINMQERYWTSIVKACDSLGYNWQIFCNGNESDYAFAKNVLIRAGGRDLKRMAKRPHYPEELIRLVTSYKGIVTARLHSAIIAYSYNIPTICAEWDPKVRDFYENIDCVDCCVRYGDSHSAIAKMKHFNEITYNADRKKEVIRKIQNNISNILEIIDCYE